MVVESVCVKNCMIYLQWLNIKVYSTHTHMHTHARTHTHITHTHARTHTRTFRFEAFWVSFERCDRLLYSRTHTHTHTHTSNTHTHKYMTHTHTHTHIHKHIQVQSIKVIMCVSFAEVMIGSNAMIRSCARFPPMWFCHLKRKYTHTHTHTRTHTHTYIHAHTRIHFLTLFVCSGTCFCILDRTFHTESRLRNSYPVPHKPMHTRTCTHTHTWIYIHSKIG